MPRNRTTDEYMENPDESILFLVNQLKRMGETTVKMFERSFEALRKNDLDAFYVITEMYDSIIVDQKKTEDRLFGGLPYRNPDEKDFRQVASFMQMMIYIERVAHSALRIAQVGADLYGSHCSNTEDTLDKMGGIVNAMLGHLLNAMLERDLDPLYGFPDLRYEVLCASDDVLRESVDFIKMNPGVVNSRMLYNRITGILEKVADDACRLASQAIYAEKGELVAFDR